MLTKRTPTTTCSPSFFGDVDRMLGDFFLSTPVSAVSTRDARFSPALDAWETDNAYKIRVDIPGFRDEDIELTFEDEILTIRGSRESQVEESGDCFHRRERWSGSFERRLRIPAPIEVDNMQAELDAGVLTVTLPKAPSAQPRRIPISANRT